jgi:hemoglobin-like flavoprotein
MTPEQVDLVRRSFDAIWPVRRKLAALFYSRFFELAPDAMPLFPNDMERQHLKLMDTIAAIVGALDKSEMFQSISAMQVVNMRNLARSPRISPRSAMHCYGAWNISSATRLLRT